MNRKTRARWIMALGCLPWLPVLGRTGMAVFGFGFDEAWAFQIILAIAAYLELMAWIAAAAVTPVGLRRSHGFARGLTVAVVGTLTRLFVMVGVPLLTAYTAT